MHIVYLCPTGTLSSLIAANLHIGNLNSNSKAQDIENLRFFAQRPLKIGMFYFIGKDNNGNHIYTLGTGSEAGLIIKSAQDFLALNKAEKEIEFVDVSKYAPKQILYIDFLLKKIPYGKSLLVKLLFKNFKAINKKIKSNKI